MRTGRPAVLRPSILMALASCQNPLGMTCVDIANATNWKHELVKQTLYRMVRDDGRVFTLGSYEDTHYFGSEEKREEARAAFGVYMAALVAERKRIAVEGDKRRHRARAKRLQALKPTNPKAAKQKVPEKPRVKARDALLAAIQDSSDPLGLSIETLRGLNLFHGKSLFKALEMLAGRGLIFVHGFRNWRRYFANAAARDAAAPMLEKLQDENAARLRREQNDRKNAAKSAKRAAAPKPAKQPKPVKAKPAKPIQRQVFARPAPVTVKSQKHPNFKDLPAIVPAHVKVTRCPGFVPRTFAPPPFFKGELSREWQQLRSNQEAA